MRLAGWIAALIACAAAAGGCGREYRTEADRFVNLSAGAGYDRGLVVCLSGAGGATGEVDRIRQGLLDGGVACAIEAFEWSTGNVLADQMDLAANREKAAMLARRIEKYQDEHPDCPVHLIGVSAGTGLVVWAVENLDPERPVANVVLVASSLSSRYDLRSALTNVSGCLYCYYSAADLVLGLLVPATGTVDRTGGDSGGLHGFQAPDDADDHAWALYTEKLSQIGWTAADVAYGHIGDHLGGTQPAYVRQYIASVAWARPAGAAPPGSEGSGPAVADATRANRTAATAPTAPSPPPP
jgi:pimeloyl-ACP methyl ester carboxylesterase